jgi:hypothetical protein
VEGDDLGKSGQAKEIFYYPRLLAAVQAAAAWDKVDITTGVARFTLPLRTTATQIRMAGNIF